MSLSAQEIDGKRSKEERQAERLEWRDNLRMQIKESIDEFGPDYNADSVRRDIESGNYFTLF
ncbi:MAG: hypothetical protein LBS79_06205, partial [Tannerella sp.]|nr:hypothetical protein [Tannerella sp.]